MASGKHSSSYRWEYAPSNESVCHHKSHLLTEPWKTLFQPDCQWICPWRLRTLVCKLQNFLLVQCVSKHFTPLGFLELFSWKLWIFTWNFTRLCSYICYLVKFCSIISNFDKVIPYKVRPSSECLHFTACKWWWIAEPARLHLKLAIIGYYFTHCW